MENNIIYELRLVIRELEVIAGQIESQTKGVGESYCADSIRLCARKYQKVLNQVETNNSSFGGGGGGGRF